MMDKEIRQRLLWIQLYEETGVYVRSYSELKKTVVKELQNPDTFKVQRERYTREHVGVVDGKVSKNCGLFGKLFCLNHFGC